VTTADTKWAEINLGAITENVRALCAQVRPAAVMAVVKANGYGHGAVPVARAALRGGAARLGVSSVAEALELRAAGIDAPILNLGYTPPEAVGAAAEANVALTLFDAAALPPLLATGRPVALHVKVDTGMNRLGTGVEEAVRLARRVQESPLRLEGFWTHFADADARDLAFTRDQLDRFQQARHALLAQGVHAFLSHAANSAAALRVPEARLDLVRLGIAIYGVNPAPGLIEGLRLSPALRWYTVVTRVNHLKTGATVGYGRTFRAGRETVVATLAAGYADGLQRRLSNRGKAIIGGRLVALVGTISMDQSAADVTGVAGVKPGDRVCLLGLEGDAVWEAEDVARAADTIPYEVLCAISARVPRRYNEAVP
jgi:alanine racemase